MPASNPTTAPTPTLAALHAAHLARQERLWPKLVRHMAAVPTLPSMTGIEVGEAEDGAPFNFFAMPGWKNIVRLVALRSDVSVKDLLGPGRLKTLVPARQLCMAIMRTHCRMSLPHIGAVFSRDHTTVLHAIRTVERGFPKKNWRCRK